MWHLKKAMVLHLDVSWPCLQRTRVPCFRHYIYRLYPCDFIEAPSHTKAEGMRLFDLLKRLFADKVSVIMESPESWQ